MVRFQNIWCCFVIVMAAMLVADITIPFAQTNDAPDPVKTNPSDSPNKVDPTAKVELDSKPSKTTPTERTESALSVEIERRFNELEREYLDDRADYIDMWLNVVAIVLTFFAVVIAISGFIGFREFRRLRDEARLYVAEMQEDVTKVREGKAEFDAAIQNMRQTTNAEVFDTLSKSEEFENSLQDLLQVPNLSFIDKAIADAYALQRNGKIKAAVQKWRSIANIVAETDRELASQAWFSVGYLLAEEDLTEKALVAYNKAIQIDPEDASAYINRGVIKDTFGDHEEAILDYDMAIQLQPNEAGNYTNRGNAKLGLGNYEGAILDHNFAIQLQPNFPGAYINRGNVKLELSDFEAAIEDYNVAINLDPNYADAYVNRAKAKAQLELIEEAKLDLQTALELEEQNKSDKLKIDVERLIQEINDTE